MTGICHEKIPDRVSREFDHFSDNPISKKQGLVLRLFRCSCTGFFGYNFTL
jgi:hypothetical protein